MGDIDTARDEALDKIAAFMGTRRRVETDAELRLRLATRHRPGPTAFGLAAAAETAIEWHKPAFASLDDAKRGVLRVWLRDAQPRGWWRRLVWWVRLWREVRGG